MCNSIQIWLTSENDECFLFVRLAAGEQKQVDTFITQILKDMYSCVVSLARCQSQVLRSALRVLSCQDKHTPNCQSRKILSSLKVKTIAFTTRSSH